MRSSTKRKTAALTAALAAVLALPVTGASAAQVSVNGTVLPQDQAWVEDGTSYIALRTFGQLASREVSWDGRSAWLKGEGLALEARPGQPYITVNDRVFYVEGGVRLTDGRTVLPLRTLAKATGAELVWNAAAGTAELTMRDNRPVPAAWDGEELYWLSRVISAESRGEPLLGQIAVGNVVLNRVRSGQYPDTVREVVFDQTHGVQFEPTANGTIYDEPTESAVLAAKLCLEGADVVGDCLYFFAPALSAGTWIVNNCTYYTTIGCHQFYTNSK